MPETQACWLRRICAPRPLRNRIAANWSPGRGSVAERQPLRKLEEFWSNQELRFPGGSGAGSAKTRSTPPKKVIDEVIVSALFA